MKKKSNGIVISQKELAPGIFDLWIETELAQMAKPGQFVGVYPKSESTLLPRPISICEIDEKKTALRLVYRVQGKGTSEFSGLKKGEEVALLGTLGNGFPLEEGKDKVCFLIGGGIGVPPILQLAKEIQGEKNIFVGYRDSNLFLKEDFDKAGQVFIATEDGSVGTKGNVLHAIEASGKKPDVLFACGPMPMLRALKAYAEKEGIKAYISLEEHMACGVGACLGCVVKTKEVGHHSHVNNARICTDGPVFEAQEVEI